MKFPLMRLCMLQASLLVAPLAISSAAQAHGIAGNRYFPGTLTFDDPAVADELILPNASYSAHPASIGDTVYDTTVAASFARLLTPDLAIGADSSWTQWNRKGAARQAGFGMTSVSLKGRFYEDDPHEALFSASVGWGIPHSGSENVGADGPATLQLGVFGGKGFGDLPDKLAWLRPFGIAAAASAQLPTRSHTSVLGLNPVSGQLGAIATGDPNILHSGFALEYSTLYLTDRFTGQPPGAEPLNQLVPLVEFAFDTPMGAGRGFKSTATANPGLSYVGVTYQIAIEAVVPLNRAAGSGVGGRVQLLMFLDDFIPSLFSKPLLSEKPLFSRD
jgi:hypothetical protein